MPAPGLHRRVDEHPVEADLPEQRERLVEQHVAERHAAVHVLDLQQLMDHGPLIQQHVPRDLGDDLADPVVHDHRLERHAMSRDRDRAVVRERHATGSRSA